MLRKPFVIYCDFECFTMPISHTKPNPLSSYAYNYQQHVAYSVGYYTVCSFNAVYNKFDLFRGANPAGWFVSQLKAESQRIYNILSSESSHSLIPLNEEELEQHKLTNECPNCSLSFSNTNPKVKHHCHYTGKYIASICNNCNLQIKKNFEVKVVFHNLNYDLHCFFQELAAQANVKLIPSTAEKYISLSVYFGLVRLVFIDSFRFLPDSLDNLVKILSHDKLTHTSQFFPIIEQFDLVKRKGVFCYDYVNSWASLENTSLPPIEDFYSKLKDENVSNEDYAHALKVWDLFNCRNLGEYSDLYLKTDILLLADVFENFRNFTMTYYGLDAAEFLTTPSLAYSSALKTTRARIDLLTDIEMILFFEKAIRGGITHSVHRYAKCNNLEFPDTFDSSEKVNYLMYWDVNSLYGYAQCQALPTGNFRWLSPDEINYMEIKLKSGIFHKSDNNLSYALEVDLEYPQHLHTQDSHIQFPFCAEHITPKESNLKKLCCTLSDKTKYVIHFENLKQCLKFGLVLKKIHRVIEFRQSDWLKSFIDLNTDFRMKSNSDFEKNLFKLIINSISYYHSSNLTDTVRDVPPEFQSELRGLLTEFADVLKEEMSNHTTRATKHSIRLRYDTPFRIRPLLLLRRQETLDTRTVIVPNKEWALFAFVLTIEGSTSKLRTTPSPTRHQGHYSGYRYSDDIHHLGFSISLPAGSPGSLLTATHRIQHTGGYTTLRSCRSNSREAQQHSSGL
ncbi:uncharacterized protein LOC112904019 [Agrilus planipennis]|uniref:DNA-directed DNA polymerase n=1 Tax=Agrilus planipennis TaxID=224129 RepID=A0A7F5QUW0_AGRPL|nr:uncharacterized protein LOC112904019 [Agrilus planipennis]